MAGETKATVRRVRCPRCKKVLQELPDIPIYKCGGCGTVLQAKHRKTEIRGTEIGRNEIDENGKVEVDHIPQQKISCLNQTGSPPKEGSSAEASTSKDTDKLLDCNVKQTGDESHSDELPISSELSCHENGDFSQELGEQMEQDRHIGSLDQDTGEGKHELGDCCTQWHRARSFSDDFRSSMELTSNETEDSSPEFQSCLAQDKDMHAFDQCIRIDKKEHGDCKEEQDKDSNICDKVSTTEEKHEENDLYPKSGAHGEEDRIVVNLSLQDHTNVECNVPENADCCRESSSLIVSNCGEHEKPTTIVEAKKEMDENLKDHVAESLKAEDNLDKNETDAIYAAESILMENSISPDNQHLEKNIIPQGFYRESSVDSFDKLPVDSPSSVFGMKQTDFSKSSMTRNYYSYDGSVSSFDGYEDQISGQFLKPPRRKFKHSAFTNSNGLHRQDESRAKDFQMNKSEMHHQAICGSMTHDMLSRESEIRQEARKSLILDKNIFYGVKRRQNKLDDLPESTSYGQPGASRSRVDKEDHASGSFIPRYFSSGQKIGTPSNYQHDMFPPYSGSFSPDIPSYAEPDKEELLQMVYELKEELNRTHISKSRSFTRFTGDEIHAPLRYNHLASAEEMCADLHRPRYPGRCSPGTGLPQLHKISRMAFSGDAADYRHQVDCSCLHGCPQDWHCTPQVPSQMMCYNKPHCVGRIGHTCYKGFYSASSSPQYHYKGSPFSLYGRENKSDDQSIQDTEVKRRVREKYYSSKRHLMPVAGGIPILACYHCSELLQLPADFLLFGRRYHRLRCSACRKVMKFSVECGTHLSPEVHDSIAPPPSMVDDCDDSIDRRDWVAASRSSKHPHAEPISCSDDYGMSFDRSCSTEGEPSLKPLESNAQNSKTSGSRSSFQPLEDKKVKSILVESPEMLKNSEENFRSEGPPLKMSKWGKSSSEIEELPTTGGSPLHRLMGYRSPSEVIKP